MMAGRVDKATTSKVFVKNLAPGTTAEELKSVFETVGRVVECYIFRTTFAFVHMQDEIGSQNAILMLNAKLINGKCISVEKSVNNDAQPNLPTTRIRVRNVPNSLSAKMLLELFSKYGAILSVEINDDEGIVTIEALADIRSAINNLNGYDHEGQKIIVEPIVNTAITYNPKHIRPVPPAAPIAQKYSGPPRPKPRFNFHNARPRPPQCLLRPRSSYDFYPNMDSSDGHNPEGRVLRDPYGPQHQRQPEILPHASAYPSAYFPAMPLFPSPRHPVPQATAMQRQPTNYENNVSIEPLFFERHAFTSQHPSENPNDSNAFYEDDQLEDYDYEIPPLFPPNELPIKPSFDQQPTPLFGSQQKQQKRFPGKRSAPFQSHLEDGEAYQVPDMIGPGEFRPPKKWFSNHPNRPKRKKNKAEPRPQPPIPEEVHKPVPDFSSYYNDIPMGSTIGKPFPPPLNPNSDFSEDMDEPTFWSTSTT